MTNPPPGITGAVVLVGRTRFLRYTVAAWFANESAARIMTRPLAVATRHGADVSSLASEPTVMHALLAARTLARNPWASLPGLRTHRVRVSGLVPVSHRGT